MAEKQLLITAPNFSTGYYVQLEGRKPSDLSQPSANCRMTRQGEVYTRPGYFDSTVNLGISGSRTIGFRMQRYPLTFFAGGTKLQYCKDSGLPLMPFASPIDTGVRFTAGTDTTMSEYAGNLIATNATDGMNRVAVFSLPYAVASGDAFINLQPADTYRVEASGNFRVNGTNIAYTSKALTADILTSLTHSGATATGTNTTTHNYAVGTKVTISGATPAAYNGTFTVASVPTTSTFTYAIGSTPGSDATGTIVAAADCLNLTSTAGANYAAGEIAVFIDTTINAAAPKGSKNQFWIESANVIGVVNTFSTNYEAPAHTHFYADSADGHAAGGLAKAYTFSGGKSGTNVIGQRGILTNILSTNDYLFIFAEQETYKIAQADVTISTGARIPRLFSPRYGCCNQFCAVVMEQDIVFLTKNKRVIKSQVGGNQALSVPYVYPDEAFDRPLFELLLNLDDDQSGSRMHYWTKGRLLFITCKISGQKITLVYDNNVQVWLPPDTNKPFNSYFEINGELYATQDTDQTVYHAEYGSSDNLSPIDWTAATGILRQAQGEGSAGLASCDFEETEFVGSISQGTNLQYQATVDTVKVGAARIVPQTAATFPAGQNIGSVQIGSIAIGGSQFNPDRSPIAYRYANSPSVGFGIQLSWHCFGDGQAASVKTYNVIGQRFTDSFLVTH